MKLAEEGVTNIERAKAALNGATAAVNGTKERGNLGVRSGRRGVRNQPGMADRNGLDLAVGASDIELLSVQLEVQSARVSGLDGDILVSTKGALAAGLQELRFGGFTVDSD